MSVGKLVVVEGARVMPGRVGHATHIALAAARGPLARP
jgi:hypothetical protein